MLERQLCCINIRPFTVFENCKINLRVFGKDVTLKLCENESGLDGLEAVRHLAYPNTDVFLVCFPFVDPSSLKRVQGEASRGDSRRDEEDTLASLAGDGETPVTTEEGRAMATRIKAAGYVNEVVGLALSTVLGHQKKGLFSFSKK
jgi:hypothetical protein